MKKTFEIKKQQTLLNDFLSVECYEITHDLFEGGQSEKLRRLRIEKNMAVSVLLFDPQNQHLVFVEQFRIGAMEQSNGAWLLENPAGYVEQGEIPAEVAFREVAEETGCELLDLVHICDFLVSPGISNEKIGLYCGRVDSNKADGIHGLDHEGEDIRVEVMTYEKAIGELYSGRIDSTSTIMAMQWLMLNKADIESRWLET